MVSWRNIKTCLLQKKNKTKHKTKQNKTNKQANKQKQKHHWECVSRGATPCNGTGFIFFIMPGCYNFRFFFFNSCFNFQFFHHRIHAIAETVLTDPWEPITKLVKTAKDA